MAVKRIQKEKHYIVIEDDSSVTPRKKEEFFTIMDKLDDVNHALRAFKKHLHDVRGESFRSGGISDNVIELFSKCFLRQHRNDPSRLKDGLQVIVSHLFREHLKCEVWCKHNVFSARRYEKLNQSSGRAL